MTTTEAPPTPLSNRLRPSSEPGCCAVRIRRCSRARRGSPTTSICPAPCTWPSSAARSRTHASRRSTPRRAKDLPGVVEVFTGAELADLWATPMPCAWPVTDDMKNPPHYPLATDTVNYVGDGVAVVLAQSNAEARDALDAIDVDYDPLEAVVDLADALPDRVIVHDDLGTNTCYRWELHLDDDAVDRAFADRRAHGEGAVHPAAPAPDVHRTTGVRRRAPALRWGHHAVLVHPDPAHPQGDGRHHARLPRAAAARRRAVGRRWLRREAQRVRRRVAGHGAGPQAQNARALGRGADREHHGIDPRPRPDPGHRAGRRRRRQGHRGPGRARGRHGRLPPTRHARDPAARRVPVLRRVRRARPLVRLHGRVHEHDADRRVSRRGPARGHLRHRAGHGRAGPEDRTSTRPSCAPATSSRPTRSRTPRSPA